MVSGSLSNLNKYRNKSEEEKEVIKIRISEYYYKKTEGTKKRINKPSIFTKESGYKNRKPKEVIK